MNPLLSIRFIILTLLFSLSIVISYFYIFNGIYPDWRWKNSSNTIPTQFSADEWFNHYVSPKGILIVGNSYIEKNSDEISDYTSRYSSSYSSIYNNKKLQYQLLFSDQQGVHFLDKQVGYIYNAACSEIQCVIFMQDGRIIVDLANYTISDLIKWEEKSNSQRPFMADGKLFMAKNNKSLIYANQEGIYLSPDLGANWQQIADISTLVENFYPAKPEAGAQYIFASNGDQLTLWYNYAFAVGSLEIRLDMQTQRLLAHKWLPLRITQAYQYHPESVFLLAEEPSRKLNSILYYSFSQSNYQVLAETGYEKLNELIASKDYLMAQLGVGDNRRILIIDRENNQTRYRQDLNLNSSLFDPIQEYFIRFLRVTEQFEESQLSEVSYQYATP